MTPALTVGLIALVSVLAAPPFGSPETAASDLVRATMSEYGIPGMQAAVWSDGRIIWREAAGLADVEQKVAVTHRTVFRLGSVSKIITASLAARLVQLGVVDLDRDIREYLPSFPDKGAVITLRNLLGHLGGIRQYSNRDYDPLAPGGIIDLRAYPDSSAALALFEDDALVAKLGTVYRYSTFGYTLAGAMLEAAAGKPFADLLQDHVLSPLELEQTTLDDLRRVVPHRTAFYDTEDGELVKAYPLNAAYKWAGGGLLSTSAELVRFGAAHFEVPS